MMGIQVMSWMLAVPLLGLTTGLRCMTPIAVLCWFARLGYLPVQGTWAAWTASSISVGVFTLFALGELVGDKLPKTPNRTAPFPFGSRLVFGGLVGAIAATAMRGSGVEGVLLGMAGAALGTFAGFMFRRELVAKIGCPDWMVAVAEDLFTVICAVFAMHVVTS
jgi:uncharacterized membrane protein